MSEMVERVARAIFESDMKWAPVLDHQFEENKVVYLKGALAAIEAMREPTEAQKKVMWNLLERAGCPPTKRWHWVWHEMIEAALLPQDKAHD